MLARPVRKHGLKAEMNVVPYIDVMLVLLVIFMVTAPMLVQGVQIELPKVAAEALPAPGQQRIVTLSVKADGSYYWNLGSEVDTRSQTDSAVDTAQMRDKIAAIVAQDPQTQVYLRADRNTEYAAVVAGIAELQRGGVSRLGLITEAP
ncbi:protein TolR [Pseudomonas putida]|jgi:biopolymer transport protein TolR|uniref:Tol-Pal system protein TolR n=1 Tax=Pseudomonas putida TaxID=303 RepID=A0AAP9SPQ3_PSEPU|nr:protein TolR [Pseudomonas putida]MBH3387553.1 protein TolR [Pseudomonas putida]MCE0957783.1 protein TolR [Pseudomonas putida]MCE0970059.1 protein TolR [Pseudomonas putida]MDD2120042.1 protein TolR [Pseudomonas putida]NTY90251.1 protein TolR [Pseudomonas putida]